MPPFSLYVITDPVLGLGRSHLEQARAAAEGGADFVQIRDKSLPPKIMAAFVKEVRAILPPGGKTSLVVNDWPWAAVEAESDGIHVGQDDLSVKEVRAQAPHCFVGKSSHSLEQAMAAEQEEPDYLALGPIFPTKTKRRGSPPVGLKTLEEAAKKLRLPWVAIGGINLDNLNQVLEAGATRIAVVTAAVGAENIGEACRELRERIAKYGR